MLIVPAVRVRDFYSKKIIPALRLNAVDRGLFYISDKGYKGRNVTLSIKTENSRVYYIIACYDTVEEAEKEVDQIFKALEDGKKVYRISPIQGTDNTKEGGI